MSQCSFNDKLARYVDGEMAAGEARALEGHVQTCPTCQKELDALRQISHLLQNIPTPELSQISRARLHQAMDKANWRRLERWAVSLSGVAASLALASMLWTSSSSATADTTTWEQLAIAPRLAPDDSPASTMEIATAQWVVSDLSTGGVE